MTGGGSSPTPGLISLAHNGVLFLDEVAEFSVKLLETLRQPLEDNTVTVNRVKRTVTFPSAFMLVCAMNPCKCGYYGHPTIKCSCKPEDIKKYMSRISGPLLDRIDIQIEVPALNFEQLSSDKKSEGSEQIRQRVAAARKLAVERYRKNGCLANCNAELEPKDVRVFCKTDDSAQALLKAAYDNLGLSARGYDRVLRLARTIADLAGQEEISVSHVAEAIQLRSLDRKYTEI
jgi:magnesium chelatase family protein